MLFLKNCLTLFLQFNYNSILIFSKYYFYFRRVNVKSDLTPEGVALGELHIAGAESSDTGAYFCQASNLYGRDQQQVQLTVQG